MYIMESLCSALEINTTVVVQLLSHVRLFAVTPWTAACQAYPSFTVSQVLLH